MCPLFYNYFSIGATVKTHKPHKKYPTFIKTQNYHSHVREIETRIKEILRTKYVNSLTKKVLDYIAHPI